MTSGLSPRMVRIVELVAGQGYSYPEAAAELGISEETVKSYATEIGRRLHKAPRKAMFWYYRTVLRPQEASA